MRKRTDFDVATIFPYFNELTLFGTQWQFRKGGVNPKLYAEQIEKVARPAFERLKDFCLKNEILRPAVTYGFFPAASDGNTLIIYREDRRTPWVRFEFPRQNWGEGLCLADYTEPLHDGVAVDSVGFQAVTVGHEVTRACNALRADNQYQEYLFLHGLGVEAAEALAEMFHQQMRREWGIAGKDSPQVAKLFKGHYRGRRYSFGYPACPNLEDQAGLFQLIDPTQVGITMTENFLLEPEQSTSAIVFHHPNAKYFNIAQAGAANELSADDAA
jgi:5-methyltetrahydrofolate--homocysteine methyltransferase